MLVRADGMSRTGENFQLTCTVTSEGGITPTITWTNSGETIASNTSDTFLGLTVTSGPTSTSVLLINPLTVEHTGNYTCQTVIMGMTYSYTYPVIVTASKFISNTGRGMKPARAPYNNFCQSHGAFTQVIYTHRIWCITIHG